MVPSSPAEANTPSRSSSTKSEPARLRSSPANRKARDLSGRALPSLRRIRAAISRDSDRRGAPPLRLAAPRERLLARPSSRRHAAVATAPRRAAPHPTPPRRAAPRRAARRRTSIHSLIRSFARSLARSRARQNGCAVRARASFLSYCRIVGGRSVYALTRTRHRGNPHPRARRAIPPAVGINRLGSPRRVASRRVGSRRVVSRHIALRRDATRREPKCQRQRRHSPRHARISGLSLRATTTCPQCERVPGPACRSDPGAVGAPPISRLRRNRCGDIAAAG